MLHQPGVTHGAGPEEVAGPAPCESPGLCIESNKESNMAQRAKMSDVESKIETLNRLVGKESGEVGSYTLAGAYNGWQVQQIINEARGITAITYGYESLTRVDQFLRGMIQGFLVGREMGRTEERAA